jgi:predicted transcriptional regulator
MDLLAPLEGGPLREVEPFDYAQFPEDVAEQAQSIVNSYRRRARSYFINTGRDLLSMKEKLEHGLFTKWIEAELGMTPRTAQNFMQAARHFGEKDKSEIISRLPPTTIYKLAAPTTPEPLRQQVVKRLEAGEHLEPAAVDAMVSEAREAARKQAEAEKEAARIASLSPEELKREKAAEKGREYRARRTAEQRAQDGRDHYAQRAARDEADARLVDLLASLPIETAETVLNLLREGGHILLCDKLSSRLVARQHPRQERPTGAEADAQEGLAD